MDAILQWVRWAGCEVARVRYLFLTHGHYDHTGGAKALRDRLGLQIVASAATARLLEAGDMEGIGLGPAKRAGLYPQDAHLEPCPVDVVVRDGDSIVVGNRRLTVLATPGRHSMSPLC